MLAEIMTHKQVEVSQALARYPMAEVERRAARRPATRDFTGALRQGVGRIRLIAELKPASPSKGVLREEFDPAALAVAYTEAGAAALSVLTDSRYFRGKLEYLELVKEVSGLPLLRKDFIIHPYQVYESRAAGADAVLLIVAILEPGILAELYRLATALGMACLVEVHTAGEIEQALLAGAEVIGINNRDLRSFSTDLNVTRSLRPLIPGDLVVVSESGITTRGDMVLLGELGVDAALVGEALVTSPHPGEKVRELLGVIPPG